MDANGVRVGIDIGGTFTDLVLSTAQGKLYVGKVSSTPRDPGDAVITGLNELLKRLEIAPSTIVEVVHGTTVGSNTILERSGAKTGLLTTAGFRDVLEIGRIRTPNMFDLTWEKPVPLVERRYRREITERIGADGSVVIPIRKDEIEAAGQAFLSEGIEAVAVCFLNSYVNPVHEKATVDLLRERFPQLRVTGSFEVLPEIKEYERTSTTVVNAYLLPRMQAYLERLADRLLEAGVQAPLQVMASNGGIIGARTAQRLPVFVVASGPAGGVTGSAALTGKAPKGDFIIFDMGGTTAKASIIEDGRPSLVTEYEFRDGMSSPSRFIKGGGYMLKVPAIDIAEVGAGGGSLAWIDEGGLIHIGPSSAGADPGPACYGRGNDRPTVADADMHLGYLNSEYLAGGTLKVQPELSRQAIDKGIATPLNLTTLDAAHGIRQIANANMARAIRSVTVERGKDPRGMPMIAFGGNGPLHGVDVARLLGIKQVIAPVLSGVFAAAGMLSADVEHNFVQAVPGRLTDVTADWLAGQISELEDRGLRSLSAEGYDKTSSTFSFFLDLRYAGQSSELTLPFTKSGDLSEIAGRFREDHQSTFGYATDEPVELANVRLTAIGRSERRLRFSNIEIEGDAVHPRNATRRISLDARAGFEEVPLINRSHVGTRPVAGPAVIESYDTTILVPRDCTYVADAVGNIIIDIGS